MTLLGPIFEQNPEAVAYRVGSAEVRYAQLFEDIDTMAHWLHDQGVGPGTRLGIRFKGDNSYWTRIAHLGAIRVGAVHATINNSDLLRRVAGTAGRPGLDFYLTARNPVPGLPEPVKTIELCPTGLAPLASQLGLPARAWEDPTTERHAGRIAFTSGTTGMPLSLVWDYDILLSRTEQVIGDVSADTRLLLGVGLMTTPGFRYPIVTWQRGGTFLTWGEQDEVPALAPQALGESTLIVTSPVTLQRHLRMSSGRWPGFEDRTIFVIGGRLPVAVRDEALRRAAARVEVHYGSTETGRTAMGDARLLDRHPGAVGKVSDGAEIEIVDSEGRPVPAGQQGIVRVRGPSMCRGYEGNVRQGPGASAFRDGWFYPGDIGLFYGDGVLAIVGRQGEAVNLGGVKLSIPDVEGKLAQIKGCEEACAVPARTPAGDLVAVVAVLAEGADAKAVRAQVRQALPRGCPFAFLLAKQLPRGPMGKIRRELVGRQVAEFLRSRQERARQSAA